VSSLLFPALAGISGVDVTRNYVWKTAVQEAISGKTTAVGLRTYPLVHYELVVNLLRNNQTPSELLQLQGLYNAVKGRGDTFLYSDPEFNTVTAMPFGLTDGTTLSFQTTATFANAGGPGSPELIQNFNGVPFFSINRFGPLQEFPVGATRTQFLLQSQNFANASWTKSSVAVLTASQAAPDGTATAAVINSTGTTNVAHFVSQGGGSGTAAAGIMELSVFVWAGAVEGRFMWLTIEDTVTGSVVNGVFDTVTGTVVSSNITGSGSWSGPAPSIAKSTSESGSNWYRISIGVTKVSANTVSAFIQGSNSSTSINYSSAASGTAVMVIWGAQLENTGAFPPASLITSNSSGAYPTMYLPTTTAQITQADFTGLSPTGVLGITSSNFGAFAGIPLCWTGSFFYRCRFDEDEVVWSKFMTVGLWTVKKLAFTSIKL
jgi:hypothetical protein